MRYLLRTFFIFVLAYEKCIFAKTFDSVKIVILATMFSLTACATPVEPINLALQAAENAIANADRERVSDYALPELGEAREKLTMSRAAVRAKNMDLAKNLADESRVSAELASAKANKIKATQINEDLKAGIITLKQEMQRNSGDQL